MKPGGFKQWVLHTEFNSYSPTMMARDMSLKGSRGVPSPQLLLPYVLTYTAQERHEAQHLKEQTLKPGYHLIGSGVETGRFQAMGQH
jgi:hypothetical protein